MLISRVINIENENVNLKKGAPETVLSQSACLRASFSVIVLQNIDLISL